MNHRDIKPANAPAAENVIALRRGHVHSFRPMYPLADHDKLVDLGLRRADDPVSLHDNTVLFPNGERGWLHGCPGCGVCRGALTIERRGWAGLPFIMPRETEIGETLRGVYIGFIAILGRRVLLRPIVELDVDDLTVRPRLILRALQTAKAAKVPWSFGRDGNLATAARAAESDPVMLHLRRSTGRSVARVCASCRSPVEPGCEHWVSIKPTRARDALYYQERRFCVRCVSGLQPVEDSR